MTQTADVDECPGKCVHSLASLICDEVREEVECPGASMKCCVERGGGMPPLPANERLPSSVSANEKAPPSSEKAAAQLVSLQMIVWKGIEGLLFIFKKMLT